MTRLRLSTIALAFTAVAALTAAPAFAQEQDIKEADELFEQGGDKNLKKAAKKYDGAIKRDPKGVSPGAYAKRAAIFFLLKEYEAALVWIDGVALKQWPGAPEILEQKALVLWQLNKKGDAIAIADKVAAEKADSFQVQLLRGNHYFSRDYAKSAEAFEAYLKHRPPELSEQDGIPRLKLGLCYLHLQDAGRAVGNCETAAKQFRKNQKITVNANNCLCAGYTSLGSSEQAMFDRAITVCEGIVENPRWVDRTGAAWFNLGKAYLEKNQPQKARQAGLEFRRIQPNKAKGYVLIGDAYYGERKYEDALRYYKDAEDKQGADTSLLKRLGQTYRKLERPGDALPKLQAAAATHPNDVEIAIELGETLLTDEIRDDVKALAAVEKLLKANPDRAELRYIAGRALYNQGKYAGAKVPYMEALKLNPGETKYRDGLVDTINRQAFEAHDRGDAPQAIKFLEEAHGYHKGSALTNRNLAVVNIQAGNCDDAKAYLEVLAKSPRGRLIADRLLGRAYMCQKKPDRAKALEHYQAAAKQAGGRASTNKLLVAEIYAELAPLIMESNIAEAVDQLEFAHQVAGTDPLRGKAITRNLALALYQRGWQNMGAKDGGAKAVEDFDRATRDKSVLSDTEALAFDFSLALARLETGDTKEALKLFTELAKAGKQSSYLQDPYDKVGAQFFAAYAEYRTNDLKARRSAATTFTKLQKSAKGKFAQTVDELIGTSWQLVAAAEHRNGDTGAARKSLAAAKKFATSRAAKTIQAHNEEVLSMGSNAVAKFDAFKGNPPEALINLGVAYDAAGEPRKAYDAWVEARDKGARAPKLDEWIDAKKRIFGY